MKKRKEETSKTGPGKHMSSQFASYNRYTLLSIHEAFTEEILRAEEEIVGHNDDCFNDSLFQENEPTTEESRKMPRLNDSQLMTPCHKDTLSTPKLSDQDTCPKPNKSPYFLVNHFCIIDVLNKDKRYSATIRCDNDIIVNFFRGALARLQAHTGKLFKDCEFQTESKGNLWRLGTRQAHQSRFAWINIEFNGNDLTLDSPLSMSIADSPAVVWWIENLLRTPLSMSGLLSKFGIEKPANPGSCDGCKQKLNGQGKTCNLCTGTIHSKCMSNLGTCKRCQDYWLS